VPLSKEYRDGEGFGDSRASVTHDIKGRYQKDENVKAETSYGGHLFEVTAAFYGKDNTGKRIFTGMLTAIILEKKIQNIEERIQIYDSISRTVKKEYPGNFTKKNSQICRDSEESALFPDKSKIVIACPHDRIYIRLQSPLWVSNLTQKEQEWNIRRENFASNYEIYEWIDASNLVANPFFYRDRTVAIQARFKRMISENEAIFFDFDTVSGANEELTITNVPTTEFFGKDTLILAVKVGGTGRARKGTIPDLVFLGSQPCCELWRVMLEY